MSHEKHINVFINGHNNALQAWTNNRGAVWKIAGAIIAAAVLLIMNIKLNTGLWLAFGSGLLCLFLALNRPFWCLYLVLLLTPFGSSIIMDKQIGGIPGLKLQIVLPVIVAGIMMMMCKKNALRKIDILWMGIYFIMFTIAFFRSTEYMGNYYYRMWGENYSFLKYLLSFYLRPCLYFLPIPLSMLFIRSRKTLEQSITAVMLSMLAFSFAIFIFFMLSPNKSDFETIREFIGEKLGMHGNELVNFYIAAIPLIFAMFLAKKKPRYFVLIGVVLLGVLILFSRGGYVAVGVELVLIMLLTRQFKIIAGLTALLPVIIAALPEVIINRFTYGLTSGTLNTISAGRTGTIWTPILQNLSTDTRLLIQGNGLYGLFNTRAFTTFTKVFGHAHNMYLNMILDSGLICLVLMLLIFGYIMLRLIKAYSRSSEVFYKMIYLSTIVSMLGFLGRGFTDSNFFPQYLNAQLWVIIGIGLTSLYVEERERKQTENTG